ncbi:NAD-dependent DNA ligase [Pullulanibacillus pueri]|uniref:BRCT domain-containing protein n=1 Tax=Pullulanibacillus pueri TaxID=1437324 RepID=A0A8J3EJU1_9BACL|nr:BRCT domain-containing protein [Pullulanibacillus pueri]MBM7679867.1 NAD-dependent DNA ligase [Pullulanibacillus pueri]GGH73233.1 hypothetical protein GCM10007096_00260 [Pullulanibacillus pueri]
MDFITIDFEIANNNLNSACSLGMVFVNESKIVDEKYYLIQPPELKLDNRMSAVHGISTRACRGEGIGNSLEERAKRFGVNLNDHHNALSDARACAELVLACIKAKKRKSFASYCSTYSSLSEKTFSELKFQSTFMKRNNRFKKINITDLTPSHTDFDSRHPFFDKQMVFTGELEKLDRKEAMQKVIDVGGIIKSGISRKTDYLVVGKQDKSLVGDDGLSTKEEKAYDLIKKGYGINIIKEDEFFDLLEQKTLSV